MCSMFDLANIIVTVIFSDAKENYFVSKIGLYFVKKTKNSIV